MQVIKCEKLRKCHPPKILPKLVKKPLNLLDEWDGYPKIFRLFGGLESCRHYITKNVVSCPVFA